MTNVAFDIFPGCLCWTCMSESFHLYARIFPEIKSHFTAVLNWLQWFSLVFCCSSGLTLFAFCVLVSDLLGAMHNLAQSLLLSLSLPLPLSRTIVWPLFLYLDSCPPPPPFLLYDLQVYFTTWFPQCPPISLGRRCPPLEASALCSVSPPLPLPPPKPSNTPPPSQPPLA